MSDGIAAAAPSDHAAKTHAARWRLVRDAFDAIADLPAERWNAEIARAAGDNLALGAELRRLLDASRDDRHHLDAPRLALGDRRDEEARVGQTVGRYRLVRLVGCGGMGAVYEGVRADGEYQQRVAVKLMRPQLGAADMAARFRRERQILAALEHPNIARLLDGGATSAGEPFFVMEYVEGTPITSYCDDARLGTRARLALFLQACTAVQHAHSRLIVHRDLKPANVLVSADAGVKLLDFGVARLLGAAPRGPDPDDDAITGARPLTLEYASPEQLRDEPASMTSDVYSLGILLYELLAGRRPYRLASRSTSAALRALETSAPPPSEVVDAAAAAAAGEPSLARLRRRLTGDLDQIVAKATRPDPDARYVSVEQLAADVRRHLDGLAVSAHPGGGGYRARKFLGRHWRGVGAASVTLVALIIGATATVVQATRAETERAKAARINAFLQDMLSAPDTRWYRTPSRHSGADVTVAEVLDDAARRASTDFAGEPALESAVRQTLGRTYHLMNRYGDARAQLERALLLDQRLGARAVPDLVTDLRDLGLAQLGLGDTRAADASFRAALSICRTHDRSADTAFICLHALNHLGLARWDEDDLTGADSLLRQTLAAARAAFGATHPAVAIVMSEMAGVRASAGDFENAERAFRASLAMFARAKGREYGERATTLGGLALVLEAEGRFAEAEPLLREEIDVIARTEGPTHPDAGINLVHLGAVHRRLGQLALAQVETARGEELLNGRFDRGERYYTKVRTYEGLMLLASGDALGAEQTLRDALDVARRRFASGDPRLAEVQDALGETLVSRGHAADAVPLLAASATTYARRFGATSLPARDAARHLEAARASTDSLVSAARPNGSR